MSPWWNRKRREKELHDEVRAHLTLAEREEMEKGRTGKEAELAARREFGSVALTEEVTRDSWGGRWFFDLIQDARFALRTLGKQPGFVAVALLTLALGIGATTVMFTLINGVLLKPLPYPNVERLVEIHGYSSDWNVALFGQQYLAYPDFLDIQRESRTMEMGARVYNSATLSAPGQPEWVDWQEISSGLFHVLGVAPLKGRGFSPEEDRPGGTPIALLGYSFWQRHWGGNTNVLGTPLVLDTRTYTIVGVMPADYHPDEDEPDVITPVGQDAATYLHVRRAHPVGTFGRLLPGATLAQARVEMTQIGRQLAQQFPDTNGDRTFTVDKLSLDVGDVRQTLWLLLGAVSLVLLIACANIASLLLARAVSREREFAMRVALGAGHGRLVRQCLTESGVLGLGGGALGIVLAEMGFRRLIAFWPGDLPRARDVVLDWHVLFFALAVSLLSSFLFGLAPALRAPARDLEQSLRSGGSRTVVAGSRRLHSAFAAAEIGLAVVLLVSAGVLGRTLLRLAYLNPGVDMHDVVTARVALSPFTLRDPAKTRADWKEIVDRARHVPGVESAVMAETVPMRQGSNPQPYWTSPDLPPENQLPLALTSSAMPDYFKVMGIPLLRGRFFDDHDRRGSELVVIIDEVMAEQAFAGQDPIGKRIWIPPMASPFSAGNKTPDVARVVGVVGHVRFYGLGSDDQAAVRAQLYYPFAQVADELVRRWSEVMSIAVRTSVAPLSVLQPLREAVKGETGDQVLYEVRTLEQLAADSLARQRFLLLLFGIFAALALLLSSIGIYGVLAYLSGQRVPEIGVRMALGATARDVIALVLRQGLGMIATGVAIGIAGAIGAARLLEHSVDGVRSIEPLTFAAMVAVLIIAALLASFVPARRASRVDPLVALRQE
jgi:predicted permease